MNASADADARTTGPVQIEKLPNATQHNGDDLMRNENDDIVFRAVYEKSGCYFPGRGAVSGLGRSSIRSSAHHGTDR
jgi:hypothetical protein